MEHETKNELITEGSALIAEFMGWKQSEEDGVYHKGQWHNDDCDFLPVGYSHPLYKSFNDLIPAVHKIRNIDISVFNYDAKRMSQFREMRDHLFSLTIMTEPLIIFIRVVEILKVYNETQSRGGGN
ncbi:MAG: hypothetical protein IM602_17385 [Cytophagales bacterium]|jgi:hypothetical protein|nr:hypothetical protein [Cytophagales bacterium]MCA6415671.1 hypothetical protein [Cytophagales bacterium]MCA6427420.1 hypothetical protein [Cytophagales bacterium]